MTGPQGVATLAVACLVASAGLAGKPSPQPPPVSAISDGDAVGAFDAYLEPGDRASYHLVHHDQLPNQALQLVYRHRTATSAWSDAEPLITGAAASEVRVVAAAAVVAVVYRTADGVALRQKSGGSWRPAQPLTDGAERPGPFAVVPHGDAIHILLYVQPTATGSATTPASEPEDADDAADPGDEPEPSGAMKVSAEDGSSPEAVPPPHHRATITSGDLSPAQVFSGSGQSEPPESPAADLADPDDGTPATTIPVLRRIVLTGTGGASRSDLPLEGKPWTRLLAVAATYGWDHLIYETPSDVLMIRSTPSGADADREASPAAEPGADDGSPFVVLGGEELSEPPQRFRTLDSRSSLPGRHAQTLNYTRLKGSLLPPVMLPRPTEIDLLDFVASEERPVVVWCETLADRRTVSALQRPGNRFSPPQPILRSNRPVTSISTAVHDRLLGVAVVEDGTIKVNRFRDGFWGEWHRPPGADRESSWAAEEARLSIDARGLFHIVAREEAIGPIQQHRIVEWVAPTQLLNFGSP